jgi:uncharacterized membrane protein YcaP (DUF421 family)
MYLTITLKLLFGFIGFVTVTRILGKKLISQMTSFDLVYAVILGGIIEEGIYNKEVKIVHVLYAITLWGVIIFIIEKLTEKFKALRTPLRGKTSVLIRDGELNITEIERNSLEMEQLRTMLRQHGVFSLREVKYAFLETSGDISVMTYAKSSPVTPDILKINAAEDQEPSTLLIDEGKIEDDSLKIIGKSKEWLLEVLRKEGIERIEEVYYAEWTEQDGLFIKKYNNK